MGAGVQHVDDAVLRALPWSDAPGAPHVPARASYLVVLYASPETSLAVTLVVAGLWSRRRRSAEPLRRIVPPVLLGAVAVLALKVLLRRPGPPTSDPVGLLGYFPSGHTAMALICTGALAATVVESRPRLRTPLLVAVGLWTALIAACLLYHRFHWGSDVLGAVLLGLLVLRVTRPARSRAG